MPDPCRVLEICGEGKTDIGDIAPPARKPTTPEPPTEGAVPVLVHKLCNEPDELRVVRRALPFLEGKKLWQKVKFVKRTALCNGSAGAVFVMDSEGDHPRRIAELTKGRDSAFPKFPMAIGVAHPCIEAWLLADPAAIARSLGLPVPPEVPEDPEALPAPQKNSAQNPKTVLARCVNRSAIAAKEAVKIARGITDLDLLRQRCPIGFAPFAREVEERIAPLFH
jgi:hypothetical protein